MKFTFKKLIAISLVVLLAFTCVSCDLSLTPSLDDLKSDMADSQDSVSDAEEDISDDNLTSDFSESEDTEQTDAADIAAEDNADDMLTADTEKESDNEKSSTSSGKADNTGEEDGTDKVVENESEETEITVDSASNIRPVFDSVDSLEKDTVPLYNQSVSAKSEMDIYYVNGETMIPYVDIETASMLINSAAYGQLDPDSQNNADEYEFTVTPDITAGEASLVRENGASAAFDAENNTVVFDDYNLFIAAPGMISGLDACPLPMNDPDSFSLTYAETEDSAEDVSEVNDSADSMPESENDPDSYSNGGELISHGLVSYRTFAPLVINLDDYGITLIEKNGEIYIPLQFLSDMVVTSCNSCNILYNGSCIILALYGSLVTEEGLTPLGRLYSRTDFIEKTAALQQFTYNELCLALDYTYGLQESHDIDGFDSYLSETGLAYRVFTDDAYDTYEVLANLATIDLADGHTSFTLASPYGDSGNEKKESLKNSLEIPYSIYKSNLLGNTAAITAAREKYYPDGIKGYEEVGNTAYITFDSFTSYYTDYYGTDLTDPEVMTDLEGDTIMLLAYANQQLHRDNCPIENVVIDLSNNGGGSSLAAICTASWFLGISTVSVRDNITGAKGITAYRFDADFDGEYTKNDDVSDMNLYCITGENSFSCGNLVPAIFKSSGKVTIIGQTSGGGSCVIKTMSTADGSVFQISSSKELCTVKNGAFYSVDEGVAPDVYISDIETIYDRERLTDIINNLN